MSISLLNQNRESLLHILQFQYYDDSASSTTETFNITAAGNATFAGNVTTGASLVSTNAIVSNVTAKGASSNITFKNNAGSCLLYTSPSPRD